MILLRPHLGCLNGARRLKAWFAGWLVALTIPASAALLLEEGFNFTAGSNLAANAPWTGGNGTNLVIVSGSLSFTNLRSTVPAGNMLQIAGGATRTDYRSFTSTAVTSGAVYCSALIRCNQSPTNSQFIAALLPSGATSHNRDTDPIALNATTGSTGCRLSIASAGGDYTTSSKVLATNSTHFIVLKYLFGSTGQASLYLDPTPGAAEPSAPTILADQGDAGSGAASLQVLLVQSYSSIAQGSFNLDSIRIGTNWDDVTPIPMSLTLTGPIDPAVCFGSAASFSVAAAGTPPYTYHWRINGAVINNATNSTFTLNSPVAADALKNFDVVVSDAFGSITSRVAKLSFTTNPASIVSPPVSQLITPGVTQATFNVTVAGDAPLTIQWRANGIAIPGETNNSYTLNNPTPADAATAIDVVVSNPCGAMTSAPVGIYFPTVFYNGYDSGAGFFGGENIILTNTSGLSFYVWSSPDLSLSVTNWTWEGELSELPLGTTGDSRYGINLNPTTSPVYYIICQTNTGPYTATEALIWLTTEDYASFTVMSSNLTISAAGIFNQNAFYTAYDSGAGFFGGENLIFTNTSGGVFCAWSSPDLSISVTNWTFEGPMSELPLGTTGESRYGINLNPTVSPVYYIFAQTNIGNFTPTEPLVWLTTDDFQSFVVTSSNAPITSAGVFVQSQSITMPSNYFYTAYDAGAGFYGGENLTLITRSGNNLYVWSSPDPSVPVTNWNFEGLMSELPLGVSGTSSYGINLNPLTSPVYYIFATNNTGPYPATEPVVWLSSSDFQTLMVNSSETPINAAGVFTLPALPVITLPLQNQSVLAGQNPRFNVVAAGAGLGYQWQFDHSTINGATSPQLALTNVAPANAGLYVVIVTNSAGAAVTSGAMLSVSTAAPPSLQLGGGSTPGVFQMTADSIPNVTYIVESATNLLHAVWLPVLTNNTGDSGAIHFQLNTTGQPNQYYRLAFP